MRALGIGRGWRCLEIGAAEGSMVRWMAGEVGEEGRIVAGDIDLRFLSEIELPRITSYNVCYTKLLRIAGIADAEEARLLVGCGVDFLGFPFRLDLHREDCSEEEAARIVKALPARVEASYNFV